MAVYAVSDIHGYMDLFLKGLEIIDFSDDDSLYVIGDAIDRGPDGIRLLNYIKDKENMDLLIGNHELLMLNSVSSRGLPFCTGQDKTLWRDYNGGNVTFENYIDLKEEERKSLLAWLKSRLLIKSLEVNGKKFVLTHSNYLEECVNIPFSELDHDSIWSIVWRSLFRREYGVRLDHNIYEKYEDITFVTGHVPVFKARDRYPVEVSEEEKNSLSPLFIGNLVNIDGGCAAGKLSVLNNGLLILRLDDLEFFSVPMKDDSDDE